MLAGNGKQGTGLVFGCGKEMSSVAIGVTADPMNLNGRLFLVPTVPLTSSPHVLLVTGL